MSKNKHLEWFSTPVMFNEQGFEAIDTNNGTIKGVLMVSEGEARGHDVFLNKRFIEDTVKLGKGSKNGVKARFGHPNMCNESLGTYLGTYKNVRLRKETLPEAHPQFGKTRYHAVGDLSLSDVSKEAPQGNLYDYILKLANDAPDKFGSSIVFAGDDYEGEINDNEGNRRKARMQRISELKATDLVDEPAATDGLFDDGSFAAKATQFLNDNPQIYEICAKHPEIVNKFINKYEQTMSKFNFFGTNKAEKIGKAQTKDGKLLLFEGTELKEGTEVRDIENSESLAGTYQLEDGTSIEVDDKNTVTSLTEATEDPAPDTDEQADKIISALNEGMIKPLMERMEAIENEFAALKKGSTKKPEKTQGVKNEVDTDQFDDADSLYASIQKKLNDSKTLKTMSNGESK